MILEEDKTVAVVNREMEDIRILPHGDRRENVMDPVCLARRSRADETVP